MDSNVLVAILSLLGTMFGTIMGAITMNRFLDHKLDLIDKKIDNLENMLREIKALNFKIKNLNNFGSDNCEF